MHQMAIESEAGAFARLALHSVDGMGAWTADLRRGCW